MQGERPQQPKLTIDNWLWSECRSSTLTFIISPQLAAVLVEMIEPVQPALTDRHTHVEIEGTIQLPRQGRQLTTMITKHMSQENKDGQHSGSKIKIE